MARAAEWAERVANWKASGERAKEFFGSARVERAHAPLVELAAAA
jgi:hypothetical protein